jgi:hypothetical protein
MGHSGMDNPEILATLCTQYTGPVALFTAILTIKNCRKCKTKIKKSFTKILTIIFFFNILSVKIVLTLRDKRQHKIIGYYKCDHCTYISGS